MGVHNLWKILDPVKESVKLESLRGQTLAVDLSVWICDAQGVKQMQGVVAKPHLRNLFFRVSHLLQLGISLVFVVDGEAPELKWEAMMIRQQARFGHAGVRTGGKPAKRPGRSHFRRLINECCQMLDYLGVSYVQSVGEAEAFCALLNKSGFADGVITQDGDAFLYGATRVYKNFSISGKDAQIESYSIEHVNAKLHLNRDKLIALGLLLGCDYVPKGVPGIGKETAMKFMMAYRETTSVLERFREWKAHPSRVDSSIEGKLKSKALVVKEFPFEKVIDEFMVVKDTCPRKALTWNKPQIDKLYEFNEKMEWSRAYTNEKIIPLLTLYDMRSRRKNHSHLSEPKPERIVKARVRQFVPCFEIWWERLECDTDPENTAEFYTTFEEKDIFTKCYPELVSAFEEEANKKNVGGEKTKRTAKKKTVAVNLGSELYEVMVHPVDSLKLSDLTLEDSANGCPEPKYSAATAPGKLPDSNVLYSNEDSRCVSRTSRANLAIPWSRETLGLSNTCTLKGQPQDKLQIGSCGGIDIPYSTENSRTSSNDIGPPVGRNMFGSSSTWSLNKKVPQQKMLEMVSRESCCDLLAVPGSVGPTDRRMDADDRDEPADLVTRLLRLRLQSSESPPMEKNKTKTKGTADDNIFEKSCDKKSCMRQSPHGQDSPIFCAGKNQTLGITFQSFNDSSLIRESDKFQGDLPASSTGESYIFTSPSPVDGERILDGADQSHTSFQSLNDSVLLKESNRLYLDQPELYQTVDQCFGDSSMLSESQVYGYTGGARVGADCSLDWAKKQFENGRSSRPEESQLNGVVGSSRLDVESSEDRDTQLYEEPSGEALEDKDTQLYGEPSGKALEDKDTQLYGEPSGEALEDKDTQLYEEPSGEALEDKDTQLYEEPSGEALEDKDTQLYEEPSGEALEDKDTQLYEEPSGEALEDKDSQLYEEPSGEALEDKDMLVGLPHTERTGSRYLWSNFGRRTDEEKQEPGESEYRIDPIGIKNEPGENASDFYKFHLQVVENELGYVRNDSLRVGAVVKQEPLPPKSVNDPDSSHHENTFDRCGKFGESIPVTSHDDSGHVVIKQEVISRKRISNAREVGTFRSDSMGAALKQQNISPKHCSSSTTSQEMTSRTYSESRVVKQEAVSPKCCSSSSSVELKSPANSGSIVVKLEVTSPNHYSGGSSLSLTLGAHSAPLVVKQEVTSLNRHSSTPDRAITIKTKKQDELLSSCKVTPVHDDLYHNIVVKQEINCPPDSVQPFNNLDLLGKVNQLTTGASDLNEEMKSSSLLSNSVRFTSETVPADSEPVEFQPGFHKTAASSNSEGVRQVKMGQLNADSSQEMLSVSDIFRSDCVSKYCSSDNICESLAEVRHFNIGDTKNLLRKSLLVSRLFNSEVPFDSLASGITEGSVICGGEENRTVENLETPHLKTNSMSANDSVPCCTEIYHTMEEPSDQLERDSVRPVHHQRHSDGRVDAETSRDLEPVLLFDDTVVSCAPGCEDVIGCDEDVGMEMHLAEADENGALASTSRDPDVGVRTRQGRSKKAKPGKKKKPKKRKMKGSDDHDMSSILRQLATSESCPSSPAILSLQSENDLLELLKSVATPESASVPQRLRSTMPTDSQLDDLLNQIGVPMSPAVDHAAADVQHDASPVELAQELLESPCRAHGTLGAKSHENSPLSAGSGGRILSDMLNVGATPTLCMTGADGSLLSDELKELLKDISTPVLSGREKENHPLGSGVMVRTPHGDMDASLLINLISAWPSGKKQHRIKKGKRKTRRKKMVPLAPLALTGDEDAGTW
ncbi:uncharacterized protein LOC135493019 [Lineus longissimus]|uniref:uncharacterized protein LOC135493019 n=1 Tax=Lineus longissimus TaxID=88925 RepID=UPI002B4E87C3